MLLKKKKRLYLVDDHPVTREGFASLINFQPDLQVCGHAGTHAKALTAIDALKPDLVVSDISLAESSGLELIKQLRSSHPALPVLVLSAQDEALYAERALRAGARGYVMKHAPMVQVMGAIRRVLNGQIALSLPMQTHLLQKQLDSSSNGRGTDRDRLSDRELEVFELIGQGQTTRMIAAKLRLSISTVETHRAHIKQKLKLKNAMELTREAVRWVSGQVE